MRYVRGKTFIDTASNVTELLSRDINLPVFHFDTQNVVYEANTLMEAAELWVAGGKHELLNVGKRG